MVLFAVANIGKKTSLRFGTSIAVLLLTLSGPLSADELLLKNGDRITGHIVTMNEETVTIKTTYGELTVERSHVVSGTFEGMVELPTADLAVELLFDGESAGSGYEVADHGVTGTWGVDGNPGTAVRSNGTGTYLELTGQDSLDAARDVTLSFWINLQDAVRLQYILSKWRSSEGDHAVGKFAVGTKGGALLIYLMDPEGVFHYRLFEGVVPFSQWTHLAIAFGNGTLTVYRDGEPVGGATFPFSRLLDDTSPLYILTAKANTDDPWTLYNVYGSLDNLRIYTRELLADEIALLAGEF